jgi:hypothetical protein
MTRNSERASFEVCDVVVVCCSTNVPPVCASVKEYLAV